jgi:hypothetical protein
VRNGAQFKRSFRPLLHSAIAYLGTTGVFDMLLAAVGGREAVRLTATALSAKEVRRWLDEPDSGLPGPLPDGFRAEIEEIIAAAGGRITVAPEVLHGELAELALWQHRTLGWKIDELGDDIDEDSAKKALIEAAEILATDLHKLFSHLSGQASIGDENSPRVRFIEACLKYLDAEDLSRAKIRHLGRNLIL